MEQDIGTWFFNDHEDPTQRVDMEPFDTIECQILENFKIGLESTKDEDKYRFACLGNVTVDIVDMMSFDTFDPENVKEHRQVTRADGFVGKRPKKCYSDVCIENDRFYTKICHTELETCGRETEKWNFLSQKWYSDNQRRWPSMKLIMWKIIEGQSNFLERHTKL